MAVAAEVFRDTYQAVPETEIYLPQIPRIFDLPPSPNKDEGVINGNNFEQKCLEVIAESEPEEFRIFGPNIIAKAFKNTFFENKNPIPDAMVFKPNLNGTLSLVELSEFKLGKTESQRKLWGFRKLIGKIKTNPNQFNELFAQATNGKYKIPTLSLPPNDEIIFSFATPRIPHIGNGMYKHDSICPVFYFYVKSPTKIS